MLHQKAKTSEANAITPRQYPEHSPAFQQNNYGGDYSPKYPSKWREERGLIMNHEISGGMSYDILDERVSYYEQGEEKNFVVDVLFFFYRFFVRICFD